VNVVWHDDKTVEFEPFSQPEAVKCIEEDTLEDVTPEDVKMIHRFCGDKVEVIRIEVRLPSHYFLYKCAGFGNPLQPFAVLDCQVQVFGIWQSLAAIRGAGLPSPGIRDLAIPAAIRGAGLPSPGIRDLAIPQSN
jgi:hypothetical protein